jgi:Carboxypeptidase regulatory-like domain/TonB-dependent Receptor Plug Domain
MRLRHSLGWMFLAFFTVLGLPLSAAAQETTGTIVGTVTDGSGAVLPGVTVVLRHTGTGQSFERVTSAQGFYSAPLLPIGQYDLTFTLPGFQQRVVRAVAVSVNDRLQVDTQMMVGGVTEVVEVMSPTSVQPTASLQTLIDSEQVQELPISNRNFAHLASIAPGVSSDMADEIGVGLTSTMNLSINGARRNAVNWLVDGVSNVDVGSNITLLSTPTLESIEEFKIITSSYAAEWPRSGGGIINVVTKSGTNQFSGSGYEFWRNDALNSNDYFRKQSTDPAVRDDPAPLRYNNFGYTLGGPLLPSREKAFFFWSQEWRRIKRAPASRTVTVPNPEWLTDPTSANYVAPADRDPIALRLLEAFPAPNLPPTAPGNPGRYQLLAPNINNTRQEVIRVDYDLSANWRLTGRYTHDLSETLELQGLFFGVSSIPGTAATDTDVPGNVASFGVKSILGSNRLNEAQYQFSSNRIGSDTPEGVRNTRTAFGISVPEVFPENANDIIPIIDVAGLGLLGANQLFRIEYINHTLTDNFSWQYGNHAFKFGGLMTFEQKNENAASVSHGRFTYVATAGGPSAFQSFLSGNPTGACPQCSYTEAERDIDVRLRFNRFEFYAQDTWRVRPNFTVDYGVRYSLYPPITEKNNLLLTFDPAAYDAASAPTFANAAGTTINLDGNPLVGIVQAGVNSPYGRGIYAFKKDNIQPRLGFSWDPASSGDTIVRGAYGIYYDQPLVGIFEQNSFTMPPVVNNVTFLNPRLSNPTTGQTPTTTGVRTIVASATDFDNPRMMQWSLGATRRVFSRAFVEVSYVGSRGDHLIRPTDINYPQPADVVALQASVPAAVNPARPFRSYGTITYRETTARSRYHGLLTAFKYQAGRAGTANVNYTLSRNRTDASNDRDALDIPQNPLDPDAEYADARTDRRHIVTASYIYEVPTLAGADGLVKAVLGGWQVAGIVNMSSGQPVPRVTVSTNNFRRGVHADLVGDIQEGERIEGNTVYWFNPGAFAPPADGTFGNSGRAPFRQAGRHQWDITLSKNFYPTDDIRLQFRADFVNAFNQVQWLADPTATQLDNTCTISITTCAVATDTFGRVLATRAPREIQLGLKLYW